ncbi:hypothetical protein F5Y04DRAFT_17446 [Hypomontagnella monticulosa]|nr:hypothetical protein F5Y04DRAFT_17446 [Hypomontagnella monticulosa]
MKALMKSIAFIFTLWPTGSIAVALSKTGNITLFSDTNCQEPVYVNNFILGIETCGGDNADTPYLDPFRSYILNERPWCKDGSRPSFDIFSDATCLDLTVSNEPGPRFEEIENPICVAPGDFKGMAFRCDESEENEDKDVTDDAPTSTDTTTDETTTATVPMATPAESSATVSEGSSTPTTTGAVTSTPSGATSTSVSTTGSSNATTSLPATPVQTNAAAAGLDGSVIVKSVLYLFIFAVTLC